MSVIIVKLTPNVVEISLDGKGLDALRDCLDRLDDEGSENEVTLEATGFDLRLGRLTVIA